MTALEGMWPPGTVLEAIDDFEIDDSDAQGNRTRVLKGARGVVCRDNVSDPPSERGLIRLDRVEHFFSSPIYNVSYFWDHHRARFRIAGNIRATDFA